MSGAESRLPTDGGEGAAGAPEGVRLGPLSRYLAEHIPGFEGPLSAEMISGGRSNLTYILTTPGGQWVLRRPPLGHILPTAHDMGREYRVISALAGTGVPVPRTLAFCQDGEVIGAPFYIMEYCPGIVVREEWPQGYGTEADRGRLSAALVTVLAHLHAVDWRAVGLADLGRPEGYLERQLRRWHSQWELSKTRDLPVVDEVYARLSASVPPSPETTIVHGDYSLHNVILAAEDSGRIVAVLDWELATLGDPLADLARMLVSWSQADDPPERQAILGTSSLTTAAPGFWTRGSVVEEYARQTGRDLSTFGYHQALAFYKMAIVCQGIYGRYLAGVTRGEGFEEYRDRVQPLAEVALALLGGRSA